MSKKIITLFLLIFVLFTITGISAADLNSSLDEDCTQIRPDVSKVTSTPIIKQTIKNHKKSSNTHKNVTLTTDNNITAYLNDKVSVAYRFNDTVDSGKLSIGYGGSTDNTINITGRRSGNIIFDTKDYSQGRYDLQLTYYDSPIVLYRINSS